MKKVLGTIIVSILAIAAISIGTVFAGFAFDVFPNPHSDNFDEGDSVMVAQMIEQLESPQIYHVKDVLDLQQQMIDKTTVDEVFMSLPPEVVKNVTSVLLKTKGVATKESIVHEYQLNDAIYSNLPVDDSAITNDSTAQEVDLTGTDLGNRQSDVVYESTQRSSDTVNGKPVKVVTKTQKYYE